MSFTKFISFFPLLLSLLPNNQQIISLSTHFLLTFFPLTFFPLSFFPSIIQTYPKRNIISSQTCLQSRDIYVILLKKMQVPNILLITLRKAFWAWAHSNHSFLPQSIEPNDGWPTFQETFHPIGFHPSSFSWNKQALNPSLQNVLKRR